MARARELGASGVEQARRNEQAEFDRNLAEATKEKIVKKNKKAQDVTDRIAATQLITSISQIRVKGMMCKLLDDQMEKLRRLWKDKITIPLKSHVKRLAQKQDALEAAFTAHAQLVCEAEVARLAAEAMFGGEDVQDELASELEDVETLVEDWHETEDEEMEDGDDN